LIVGENLLRPNDLARSYGVAGPQIDLPCSITRHLDVDDPHYNAVVESNIDVGPIAARQLAVSSESTGNGCADILIGLSQLVMSTVRISPSVVQPRSVETTSSLIVLTSGYVIGRVSPI
jgi:hypothetical protein